MLIFLTLLFLGQVQLTQKRLLKLILTNQDVIRLQMHLHLVLGFSFIPTHIHTQRFFFFSINMCALWGVIEAHS